MKLGILLSGGKDSLFAAQLAQERHDLVCAITIKSENKESYMFHTPNIDGVTLQAEAMQLPLVIVTTKGEKEKELTELTTAIMQAKEEHGIEGITTGAVASQYQASRIQAICHELDLWCVNPLWQVEQNKLLQDLLDYKFEVVIAGVFAYPFEKSWLGKVIDEPMLTKLKTMQDKYEINPAGEGGEIETYVTDCPLFHKKISITESQEEYDNYAGTYELVKAELIDKKQEETIIREKKEHRDADVLIINTSTKEAPLFIHEFVRPVIDVCEKANKTCKIVNIENIPDTITEKHIIISGTALKDNDFLAHKKNILQLLNLDKPILGICAGAELLLPEEVELQEVLEIGPKRVEELEEDKLTTNLDGKECYFLHQLGIRVIPFTSPLKALLATQEGIAAFKYPDKPIYGVQFHPEVSRKDMILKFLTL